MHQSCRYSQVHTRRRSLARMSRPLMRAISADAMLRRAGAAVARHPPPQKSANFCRLFGVWRRGGRRRAGNIPASDPDTARRPSAVSRAMPSQTLAPRPRRRGWRERDGRHRASVPGTESSHKFNTFHPPGVRQAQKRRLRGEAPDDSDRGGEWALCSLQKSALFGGAGRRRSLARMSRPLMRAISAGSGERR